MFPVRIETARLLIDEWRETDWALAHEYASDAEVVKYEIWGPNSEEETLEFLRLSMSFQHHEPRCAFELAIRLKSDGRLIGGGGIRFKERVHREALLRQNRLQRGQWRDSYLYAILETDR